MGVVAISTPPHALSNRWKTQQISRYFWAEGCSVGDVNKDGKMDVLSGPYWYAGPTFEKTHLIYAADETFVARNDKGEKVTHPGYQGALGKQNKYANNFISYTYDFNNDDWVDYLVIGFPGDESYWYQNPAKQGGMWPRHVALRVTENESPSFTDIDGDKIPDLLAMSEGALGYAKFDPAQPTAEWKWHAISAKDPKRYQKFTHGLGHGDINNDGRIDILEKDGWREQPPAWDGIAAWTFHAVPFGSGGAQMFGYDVNGDKRTDVITSLEAHGYGVAWFEQNADATWTKHLLTDTPTEKGATGVAFTQPHALELVDLDGDKLKDIVTGKRFWAHGSDGDVEPGAAPVIYAFELKRSKGKVTYTAKIIHDKSGIGTHITAADVDQNGKPDIVTANKMGCFIHYQQ